MLSFLRSHNDDQFDHEQDRDLIAAVNEARSPAEIQRISSTARQRLSARARARRGAAHVAVAQSTAGSQRQDNLKTHRQLLLDDALRFRTLL